MSTPLQNDLKTAKGVADQFINLAPFLNWESIEKQALRKYPIDIASTLASVSGKPLDILQALLASPVSTTALDYKSNLVALDSCIAHLLAQMSSVNKTSLRNKLSNIGVASFWDTLGELWFAERFLQSGQKIQIDFPLHQPVGTNQPSDADIAIVDGSGNPIWLFDATCPSMPKELTLPEDASFLPDHHAALRWIEDEVEKKYQSKFAAHIANLKPARAAVILTLIKADQISAYLLPIHYTTGLPAHLNKALKAKCPGLEYAVAGRFQKGQTGIDFVKIAELA